MDSISPVRPQRTFEIIGDRIRDQLRNGTLKPGDKLPPERALAEQFGASRNAVREALRSLEHAGLIALQKGAHGGAFITDGNPSAVAGSIQDLLHLGGLTLGDVTEARLLIESAIVATAVARATTADIERLRHNINAVEALTRDGDLDAKSELNIQFHILLAESTGNPVLILIMRTLMDVLRAVHRPVTAEDTSEIVGSRRRFLAHLEARNPQAATSEMRTHLTRLHDLFAAA